MSEFGLKEAVDLYQALSATSNELWTLFIVVGFGILGFAFGKETKSSAWKLSIVLSLAFFGFAYSNRDSMNRTQIVAFDNVAAIQSYLDKPGAEVLPDFVQPLRELRVTRPSTVYWFHWASTVGVILAIWIPVVFSKKSST